MNVMIQNFIGSAIMKRKIFLLLTIVFLMYGHVFSQDFPIGIWFGGEQNAIDAVADMGFTWIQAYGGWDLDVNNLVLQNSRDLNVIAIRERNINCSPTSFQF